MEGKRGKEREGEGGEGWRGRGRKREEEGGRGERGSKKKGRGTLQRRDSNKHSCGSKLTAEWSIGGRGSMTCMCQKDRVSTSSKYSESYLTFDLSGRMG